MTRKSVLVPEELHEQLKSEAQGKGVTIPALIAALLGGKAGGNARRMNGESLITTLFDNDDVVFYTKIPQAVKKKFEGVTEFAVSRGTLKRSGKKVVIFKNGSERRDCDSWSHFMLGSHQSEVSIDNKIVRWLGCGHGEKIIWKIGKERIWLEKYEES